MIPAIKFRILGILQLLCLISTVVVLVVWPLPDTIAARNIGLITGAISGLIWVLVARPNVNPLTVLPALCLLGVPIWLWLHYFFLPVDAAEQWYDLTGTWLRVALGLVMATSLGLMLASIPKRIYWIWGALSLMAIFTFLQYLFQFSVTGEWLINDFKGPYKYKSALVFFVAWPCLWGYAILQISLMDLRTKKSLNYFFAIFGVLLVSICFVDFIAAHALNGVLIAGFMGVALVLIFTRQLFLDFLTNKKNQLIFFVGVIGVLVLALSAFWSYDQKYEKKLTHLLGDMRVAAQIDSTTIWQRDSQSQGPYTPNDLSGRAVNGSTYERTAWFVKGVEILFNNPLGAGYSHLAFKHYMQLENPRAMLTKTHSGWLDFALGVGLPGLMLTWAAIGIAIFRLLRQFAINQTRIITIPALWMLVGMWFLWWPAEVSEREFIEQFFFMVCFLATVTAQMARGKISVANKDSARHLDFDIYVIHNHKLKERRDFLTTSLSQYPNVCFVEIEKNAPTFMDQTYLGLNERRWVDKACHLWSTELAPRVLSPGEIACTASHFYAFEQFLKNSDKEWIMVLEDDAIFKRNFGIKIQAQLGRLPKQVGAVFIGGGFPHELMSMTLGSWHDFLIKHHPATNTTVAYLLRRSTVEKIMQSFSTFDMPIDYELAYLLMITNTIVFHQKTYSVKEGSKFVYESSIGR